MKPRTAGLAAWWLVLVAILIAPAAAQADRPFSLRFGQNRQGDITIAANTVLSCVTSEPVCPGARDATLANLTQANNNARVMTYVDSDGDDTTFNSSDADLVLPTGARVLFAGLYYGGRLAAGTGGAPAPTPSAAGVALIRAPGDTGYTTLPSVPTDTGGQTYQAFHDVTSIVQAAGAGTYRVANVQSGTGKSDGQLAGWSLVVAYGDPAASSRNLSVFDGLQQVGSGSTGVTIPLSGFRTPATGPVNSSVGIVAYEGDLGTTGDGATIQGATGPVPLGSATPGSPPLNARNNLFDSSISAGGASVTSRAPSYRNQLGFDADLFALPGVLGNNQTATQVQLATQGDAYQPGVVTIATDLFAPKLVATKSVDQADADPGDTLTYTLNVQNTGQDGAQGVVISDAIPDNTAYVPGSLQINGVAVSDAADGDQGEVAAGSVTMRLGAGANGATGGSLAPGSALQTVRFQVQIDGAVPPSTLIRNVGRVDFTAQTTGEADAGVETAPAETVVRTPAVNLVLTKDVVSTPDPTKSPTSAWAPDDPIVFRVTVVNQGSQPAPNSVVTDFLPTPMRYLGAFNETAGAPCGPAPTAPPTPPPSPPQCAVGTLAPGQTVSVLFAGDLPNDLLLFPSASTLTNRVVGSSGGVETNPDDNEATASIDTLPINDVFVSKSFAPAEPLEGGRVVYTMVIGSRGPDVSDVSFADLLPSGIDFDSISISRAASEPQENIGDCEFGEIPEAPGIPLGLCTIPRMEVGGQRIVTLIGTLRPGMAGQTINNVSAVTPTGLEDTRTFVDNRSDASFLVRNVDLSLSKSQLDPGPIEVGEDTTFRLTARNDGDGTAQSVVIQDTLPAGLTPLGTPAGCTAAGQVVTCDAGDLGPGAEISFDIGARAELAARGTTVTNAATVSSASPDLAPANDAAAVDVEILRGADLAVTKTRLDSGPVEPGTRTTFRITARNIGDVTSQAAQVGDLMPAGLTPVDAPAGCTVADQLVICDAGDLAPGAEISFDLPALADPSAAGTTVTNLGAAGSSVTPDYEPGNDSAELAVDIAPLPTEPPPPPPSEPAPPLPAHPTDVALRVIAPTDTVRAGEPSRWRIEVANLSQVAATGVTVDGSTAGAALGTTARVSQATGCGPAAPSGCVLGTLGPGETRTITVTLTPRRAGTLTLSGSVRAAETETRSDNNADQATVQIAPGLTNVATRVSTPDSSVLGGERIPVRVTVRNRGPRAARDVNVCVRLPGGLGVVRRGGARLRGPRLCWRVASLPAGAKRTLTVTARTTCVQGRRTVRATVRGDNFRTRRARLPLRFACGAQRPRFTG